MIIPVVTFLSGACVMMVEIVGSRLIAPYVGSSIHAWTALLSVILGSLSIGYAIGGKVADRYPSYSLLSVIFFLASCSVITIKTIEWIMLPFVMGIRDIRILAIVLSLGLFSIPSVILGMISPYAIRLSLHSLSGTSRVAGNLSAVSTIGSIVGTILTGFYLLGTFGHATILVIVAGILVACGIAVWLKGEHRSSSILLIVVLPAVWAIQFRNISYPLGTEYETDYQRIFVRDTKDTLTQRPMRTLMIDLYGIQSAMYLDNDTELVSEYTKVFRIADAFVQKPERVLLIGGAGYAYPKDLLKRHQEGYLDVVEIDPGMTKIAKQLFFLPQSERMTIRHEDGRVFFISN